MPENISNILLMVLFIGIWVLAVIGILKKAVKNKFAPVQTVQAVVIDKHKLQFFSKYSGTGRQEKYVIVFSAEGKKRSFYVSKFSYDRYKLNEKGTLKFRGDRIIQFN